MVKYAYLGKETVSCKNDVYDLLQQAFEFPEYFGRNLDALCDCLTDCAAMHDDYLIVLSDTDFLSQTLGDFYPALLQVIRDSSIPTRIF